MQAGLTLSLVEIRLGIDAQEPINMLPAVATVGAGDELRFKADAAIDRSKLIKTTKQSEEK